MGQIMHYWQHPLLGDGANRYLHPDYGVLEEEFGTTIYDWEQMPLSEATLATALLLYEAVRQRIAAGITADPGAGQDP